MHRAPFWPILLSLLCYLQVSAQKQGLEVFWHYTPGTDQELSAYLSTDTSHETCYLLLDAEILEVRLSEGRLKESLSYRYANSELCISLDDKHDPRARIFIRYRLKKQSLEGSPFVNFLDPGLVINALNMEGEAGSGSPGLLFPSPLEGRAQRFRLNLKLDHDLNIESPLETEYRVVEDEYIAHFLLSSTALSMKDFYLAIGEFRRFDADDLEDEIAKQNEAIAAERAERFERDYKKVLYFISEKQNRIYTNESLKKLAALAPSETKPSFPKISELPGEATKLRISLALVENAFEEQWPQHWASYWQEQLDSLDWQKILRNHQAEGDSSYLFWQFRLASHLAKANLKWADTLRPQSKTDSLRLNKARYFLAQRKPLSISIRYRLQMQKQALEFYLEHGDTNLVLPLRLAGELHYEDQQKTFSINAALKAEDTITLAIEKAPRSLYLKEDPEGLLIWQEQRPLNYLLYDLSKAPSPALQRAALLELLESAAPKLKATVVGIALDSGEPDLQLLGLSKVKELNTNGLARLKSSIEDLAAEASNVKVKQKAREVLEELEP
jgi:hypothetical protein